MYSYWGICSNFNFTAHFNLIKILNVNLALDQSSLETARRTGRTPPARPIRVSHGTAGEVCQKEGMQVPALAGPVV